MKIFGKKQPPDEDVVAVARLSAVAARFKAKPSSEASEAKEQLDPERGDEQ